MTYLVPADFVKKAIDSGESKIFMATKDTFIRAYMAGAILALAAAFAVTVTQSTGQPIVGAILFPVGFCMLYLLGYDLLTGVVVLTPLALWDRRPGVTVGVHRRGDDVHRLHLRLCHRPQPGGETDCRDR
jgi:formate/nitrite transporter FocA (FNT family)